MILQAIDAVRATVAGASTELSVACVQTTRPKYLVFANDSTRPEWVLQFGRAAELLHVHNVLQTLAGGLGDRVPASLTCVPWGEGYVHVQSGLEGAPWFVLRRAYNGADAWSDLLYRALETLADLRQAIRGNPAFCCPIVPAEQLEHERRVARAHLGAFPPQVEARVSRAISRLLQAGAWMGVAQHGDYGLNNLLVSSSGPVRIIDFDEFGMTAMPLQDEFGLALSLHLVCGATSGLSLEEGIRICIGRALHANPDLEEFVEPLLVYHFLWRLNQCHQEQRRFSLRSKLVELLGEPAFDRSSERYTAPRVSSSGFTRGC